MNKKQILIVVLFMTISVLTSNSAKADYLSDNSHIDSNISFLKGFMSIDSAENTPEPTPIIAPAQKTKTAKSSSQIKGVATITVTASAYSSTPNQTDASPFITANGEHVYWGGVAANIIDANGRNIPFGTKIMIPKLFGNQVFTVNDRMNRRYQNNLDVWFPNTADARIFGRKTVEIVILAQL